MKLLTAALASTLATTLAAALFAAELGTQNPVTAHEWGTFTSVAGSDGDPVLWSTFAGPPDLPCFVERAGVVTKGEVKGLVRMETPVLYFYAAHATKLAVDVKFPLGNITEWYPKAGYSVGKEIAWDPVELTPGPDPQFPTSKGASRYFAARNTDATPLKIGGQAEKMIFYRGVGGFSIPLRPTFTADGKIALRNVSQDRIPLVIVFENHGGKVGYRIQSDVQEAIIARPELDGRVAGIRETIASALVDRGGLYPKEAAAMLDTWQDSWFEEGTRVIYMLPQRQVDAVLPLTIRPAPVETMRAFVGRIEMLSPAMKQEFQAAAASSDGARLLKYGRFLDVFTELAVQPRTSSEAYRQVASAQSNRGSCIP